MRNSEFGVRNVFILVKFKVNVPNLRKVFACRGVTTASRGSRAECDCFEKTSKATFLEKWLFSKLVLFF
jgi:hypothetical protein